MLQTGQAALKLGHELAEGRTAQGLAFPLGLLLSIACLSL